MEVAEPQESEEKLSWRRKRHDVEMQVGVNSEDGENGYGERDPFLVSVRGAQRFRQRQHLKYPNCYQDIHF